MAIVTVLYRSSDEVIVPNLRQICFDRVASMPKEGNEPQIREARDLVQHIFDRKAALLPGYFIVNEILKVFPGQW